MLHLHNPVSSETFPLKSSKTQNNFQNLFPNWHWRIYVWSLVVQVCRYLHSNFKSIFSQYDYFFIPPFKERISTSKLYISISLYIYSDVLLWTPSHGWAKAERPARTYIQEFCADTGCSPKDLPEVMDDRDGWQERVRDIHVNDMTWHDDDDDTYISGSPKWRKINMHFFKW